VFLVRKIFGNDAGTLYAMKVLRKATLKGKAPFNIYFSFWIKKLFLSQSEVEDMLFKLRPQAYIISVYFE